MEGKKSHIYLFAWGFALLATVSALAYKFYYVPYVADTRVIPTLGIPGSTHAHVSLVMIAGDVPVNFCQPKYMLASQLAHFEENNCTIVHKHATGVTLQTFLESIEVNLSEHCFSTRDQTRRCNDKKNTLRAVLNGKEIPIPDFTFYELRNNDHILINFGPEVGIELRFKYNNVPSIPVTVNEPGESQ